MKHLLLIIDRKEFEERLAFYLTGRPVSEQVRFLRQHGVPAEDNWDRSQLRQEVSNLVCSMSDLALGAQSQQLLIREEATGA